MPSTERQLYATDTLVERDRWIRNVVFTLCLLLILIPPPLLGTKIARDWFDYGTVGFFIGLLFSIGLLVKALPRFLVQVRGFRAFLTVDLLRTFLSHKGSGNGEGDKQVYITYGPGLHVSLPWESRSAGNNVSLEEASETFSVEIQTPSGVILVEGSLRMRPDIRYLVPFLGGVAAMASDVTDLIKAFIIEFLSDKTVLEALRSLTGLNEELQRKFGIGTEESKDPRVSDFEERFGVNVGDITIGKLLPSKEVQKTMSGLTEAASIADGAAVILGYKNAAGARRAVSNGTITQDDLNRARDRFMAASENLRMTVDANEYTIKLEGLDKLDPDVVNALAQLAPMVGAAYSAAGRTGRGSGRRRRPQSGQQSGGNNG